MSVEAAGFSSYGLISGDTGGTCCPPVVDPYSWVALLGGITLTTYFLRVAIITNIMGRRKRDFASFSLLEGEFEMLL